MLGVHRSFPNDGRAELDKYIRWRRFSNRPIMQRSMKDEKDWRLVGSAFLQAVPLNMDFSHGLVFVQMTAFISY